MNDQEKQRATHLLILLCYTIFSVALIAEAVYLGWEKWVVILLLLGVAAGWTLHIGNRLPLNVRLNIYVGLMMLMFFFYGIHETNLFDLAPVIIMLMVLCSAAERFNIIKICMCAYYITVLYDVIFVVDRSTKQLPIFITRLLLHFAVVYMTGRLLKIMVQRRGKERKTTDDMISRLMGINQRTEDFLTNMSHELRTPINAVTGITTMMLKNEEDEGKKKDLFTIQMAGQRLFRQIEDILDYTEIENEKMIVTEETYMISSIVNDVIKESEMQEREYTPELIFDLDATMPAALQGDGKKIKKILRHLINNAIKFTKKGGVYVRIYTLKKDYGVNLCIIVEDTGDGISEAELEKITEGFYQAEGGRNRKAGGLGLGLSIVTGMVACMEGFMQIKSSEGKGTKVTISIPQKVADNRAMITLENRSRLSLACYLKLERYDFLEVRNFYNITITHLIEGLDASMRRVFNTDELKTLTGMYQITHLFVGTREYEENSELFEELADQMSVIVVADKDSVLPAGSKARLLGKPFYCLSVANMLNAELAQDDYIYMEKRMLCPDVKTLVVDDEPMNLMVAEGIFKEYEMQVKTAYSGIAALELCEKEDFDLIFLDHMMPEMDGVETLKRIRQLLANSGRSAVIIAFTANAVSGAREMFYREGFDEFVSKPIEMMELERVLRSVLPKSAIRYVDKEDRKRLGEKSGTKKNFLLEKADIHVENGLQYCQNNTEFYEELLLKFANGADKKQEDIRRFFEQEDWENYRIVVHALKSTARMIGADTLFGLAKNLEDASKNRNVNYIRAHHENLLVKYHETVRSIQSILGQEEKAGGQTAYQEISAAELAEKLEAIADSLKTFESEKAKNLIGQLNGFAYGGKSVAGLLEEAGRNVDDFEMTAASEKVKALIGSVGDGET